MTQPKPVFQLWGLGRAPAAVIEPLTPLEGAAIDLGLFLFFWITNVHIFFFILSALQP